MFTLYADSYIPLFYIYLAAKFVRAAPVNKRFSCRMMEFHLNVHINCTRLSGVYKMEICFDKNSNFILLSLIHMIKFQLLAKLLNLFKSNFRLCTVGFEPIRSSLVNPLF